MAGLSTRRWPAAARLPTLPLSRLSPVWPSCWAPGPSHWEQSEFSESDPTTSAASLGARRQATQHFHGARGASARGSRPLAPPVPPPLPRHPGPASSLDLWLLLLLRSVDFFEKQVASDSGTITLRCKDLRVLQLEIEGAEATLDIAPSIETNTWRLSEVNGDFSLCPRYPRAVIVPHVVDDDALARSARFGQGGRFPVLCYPLLPAAP
ncbi:PREDICTED: myotubularin-related protein 9-like [Cercocebus atys]|uniref:myotubularin-related protein 9-like n=1 Tax=Cercocebus atys TaxID=9531 RepID=UPI0005F50385|nr:PREDICTED: myotubularin-related protein 9-like [Cercocebus atys]